MILRSYQEKLVSDIRASYASGLKSVCAVGPTGMGKSLCFAEIARLAAARGRSVCVVVHRDTLLRQASEKMREIGVEYGIIAAGYTPNRRAVIQIASVQSLIRRLDKYEFDFLIFDEAHLSCSASWKKLRDKWPLAHVLGFTATPVLGGGRGLITGGYQKLILGPTPQELINDGFLTSPDTFGPIRKVDISSVKTVAGDYAIDQLEAIVDTPKITGDALAEVLKICPGVPTMIFCITRKHAADVAAHFSAAGLRAASVDGSMPRDVIRDRIAALSDGRIQYLASCDLIGIGFDAPAVACAVFLRHTQSVGLYLQQAGRALRPVYAPGHNLSTRIGRLAAIAGGPKPRAFLVDHVGNFIRHSLADDDREWTLEGKKKRPGDAGIALSLTQCGLCLRPFKSALSQCPHVNKDGSLCGWMREAKPPRELETQGGALEKVDKAALRRAKKQEEWACKTLKELQDLGKKRGYLEGWAFIKWKSRPRPKAAIASPEEIFE